MQRPPEARGQRSGYQRNGVHTNQVDFAQTCEGVLENVTSPLSQTQTKGRVGGGSDDDDLFGPGATSGVGSTGLGINEHNFKSQTLQFQTNLGHEFINLFAPSEQGAADRDSDNNNSDNNFSSGDEDNA